MRLLGGKISLESKTIGASPEQPGGWIDRAAYWIPHYFHRAASALVSDGIAWAYGLASPRLRDAALQPILQINRLVDLSAHAGAMNANILSGAEANSGLPLKAALLGTWETGQHNTLPYFEHLLFGDGPVVRERAGSLTPWMLRRETERLSAGVDLVIVLANNLLVRPPSRGRWAFGPAELRLSFDFLPGETWDQVERRLRGQGENLRHIRREGYTCRTSRSEAEFEQFYHQFYVPMVKTRYKEYGSINTEAGLRKVFLDGGELLFVEDPRQGAVSAGLHIFNHGVMYALLFGVRGGDRALVHKGALAAQYYYSLRRGHEKGCRRHDASVCLPFGSSGVLRHKIAWGYVPRSNPWRPWSLLVWAPHESPAALAWLEANPFLPPFGRYSEGYFPALKV